MPLHGGFGTTSGQWNDERKTGQGIACNRRSYITPASDDSIRRSEAHRYSSDGTCSVAASSELPLAERFHPSASPRTVRRCTPRDRAG